MEVIALPWMLFVAERVGFEPTYRLLTDNSISSRARYGQLRYLSVWRSVVYSPRIPGGQVFFRQVPSAELYPQYPHNYIPLPYRLGSIDSINILYEKLPCSRPDSPPQKHIAFVSGL